MRAETYTTRLLVVSFACAISVGAVILLIPTVLQESANTLTFVEAIFTSTSAVCLTGLTVRDTGGVFNWLGQLVILILIQVGGIGLLTFSNVLFLMREKRLGNRQQLQIEQALGSLKWASPAEIAVKVIRYTAIIEFCGALVLSLRFAHDYPWPRAIWLGVFHAVSAFCNAGFSLFHDSLEGYRHDWVVNFTVISLIVLGGLGFIVFTDISRFIKHRWKGKICYLSLHTRIVLITTGILLLIGTLLFVLVECYNPALNRPWWAIFSSSLFLSVTSRTAGFNTVPIAQLTNPSLLILLVLMLIGGSPGGMAGGSKTTTIAVLFALAISRIRNRLHVEVLNRRIPSEQVSKAIATAFGFGILTFTGLILVQVFESFGLQHLASRSSILDHVFEVVSALCTVGLSTGITTFLSVPSLLTLTCLMFIGRLSPLLIAASLIGQRHRIEYTLPEEHINIG